MQFNRHMYPNPILTTIQALRVILQEVEQSSHSLDAEAVGALRCMILDRIAALEALAAEDKALESPLHSQRRGRSAAHEAFASVLDRVSHL